MSPSPRRLATALMLLTLLGSPGIARAQESFDRLPVRLSEEQQRDVLSGKKTVPQALPIALEVVRANAQPVAVSDSYGGNEDTALTVAAPGELGNDTDEDVGGTLTAVLVGNPSHDGALSFTLRANGSFTCIPLANYNDPDSFTYKANDGTADSDTATVSITVNAVNDEPMATADAASARAGVPLEPTCNRGEPYCPAGICISCGAIRFAITRAQPKPSKVSPAIPRQPPALRPYWPSTVATGASRMPATTSSTGSGTKIAAPSAPATAPRTSPPYATSPSVPSSPSPAILSPPPSSAWRVTSAWSSTTCA